MSDVKKADANKPAGKAGKPVKAGKGADGVRKCLPD